MAHRLPRFQRSTDIPPLCLTARDREILRHVLAHRFLRSTHLLALVAGSRQQILRRLQRLYHAGYLDRPRAQIDYYRHGSQPMVYGLGNTGAQWLAREDALPARPLDWSARNRSVTRYFLQHTLAVADVMVALDVSARKHTVRHLPHPGVAKWSVTLERGGIRLQVGVVPDRVFGLQDSNGERWFFLEADRATMPVERHQLKQTSFYRKLLAYHATWRQGVLKDRFPRFRVLTVTTTPERVRHLIEAAQRLPGGHGLFLFTDHTTLAAHDDFLTLPWRTVRDDQFETLK